MKTLFIPVLLVLFSTPAPADLVTSCKKLMLALVGNHETLTLPKVDEKLKVLSERTLANNELSDNGKVKAILKAYVEERLKILGSEHLIYYAQKLLDNRKVVDASINHFYDKTEQPKGIPSPIDVLKFRQQMATSDEMNAGIAIEEELSFVASGYYFQLINSLENLLQVEQYNLHIPIELPFVIINPYPSAVVANKKMKYKVAEAAWTAFRLIPQEIIEENLTTLKNRKYKNEGLEASRLRLIKDIENIYKLSLSDYQDYRWRQLRSFSWITGYVLPKFLGSYSLFFIPF